MTVAPAGGEAIAALSTRFLRWGAGFLIVGVVTGFGPLVHYLLHGSERQCGWAPVHAHAALLGWVGFTLFGLVYRALANGSQGDAAALGPARLHFRLAAIGTIGVTVNGLFGYYLLHHLLGPDAGGLTGERIALSVDGVFFTLFGLGCVFHLIALRRLRS